ISAIPESTMNLSVIRTAFTSFTSSRASMASSLKSTSVESLNRFIFLLLSYSVFFSILRRRQSGFLFESLAEIIRFIVRQIQGNIKHRYIGVHKHLLRQIHFAVCNVGDEIHPHLFLEDLAEIVGADVDVVGHVLQADAPL